MNLDDAYANSAYIPDGDGYYARWASAAAAFRATQKNASLAVPYGSAPRQTYDLFRPVGPSKGTVVVVHGGFWMACSPSDFSHLAKGAVSAGYECAMPSYTLAPDTRISDVTVEIRAAIDAIAASTVGPIYLVGHSAGAHLVARMLCNDMQTSWHERIARVMPISPLSDLTPLLQTSMNTTLRMDEAEATRESPVRYPAPDRPVTVWVGGAERPAFLDQAKWLAEAWDVECVIEDERHHFDVIEGLQSADSQMMRHLLR